MAPHQDDRPIEELERDAESNRDKTTRREALEQELEEQGRSDEGEDVGDQME